MLVSACLLPPWCSHWHPRGATELASCLAVPRTGLLPVPTNIQVVWEVGPLAPVTACGVPSAPAPPSSSPAPAAPWRHVAEYVWLRARHVIARMPVPRGRSATTSGPTNVEVAVPLAAASQGGWRFTQVLRKCQGYARSAGWM